MSTRYLTALVTGAALLQGASSSCAPQSGGIDHKSTPDTEAGFLADTYYASAANASNTPDGYDLVFENAKASTNAQQYLGYTSLTTYDVKACADGCTSRSNCQSFNIYFERDPSLQPDAQSCANPPSITTIKCAWYGSVIDAADNTNTGQYRSNFKTAKAGGNGYTKTQKAGFRKTPVMGYNSYNDVSCNPTQALMESTMSSLHDQGFIDLGYSMFQIDCGWQGRQRQANGSITYDPTNFPDGISYLSKKAIALGFQWGMYTDEGVYACDTNTPLRVGSLGHEMADALQFAGWNVVYMKVDNCYVTAENNAPKNPDPGLVSRYSKISNALRSVGIENMLVCEWGVPYQAPNGTLEGPAQWTPPLSTSFRVADDISGGYFDVYRIMNEAINVNVRGLSGNGHYADMDLLEVGNGYMSADEEATHFAIWAMFKSALMISTSVSKLSTQAATTLKNKDLIAINQDSLMKPVTLVQRYPDHDLFAGPLANGDQAVLLIEQTGKASTMSVNFSQLGISSATVKNLWTGETTVGATSYQGAVAAHGSLPLRLSAIKSSGAKPAQITWIQATSGTLSGGAVTQSCPGCSNGENVGYITSNGGSVTLSGIKTSQATQDVLFDYVNCDVAYGFQTQFPNARGASISVNNGPPVNISFPLSGYNWSEDVYKNFRVQLSGFSTTASNSITITGDGLVSYYGPNFDRIGVVA